MNYSESGNIAAPQERIKVPESAPEDYRAGAPGFNRLSTRQRRAIRIGVEVRFPNGASELDRIPLAINLIA
jgi:hypothetical protein